MKFFELYPEVAGGWGENTQFTRTPGQPVVVHQLHYRFDGWLGDELLKTSRCYIVTDRLADGIRKKSLSGYSFRPVEISTSEQFREFYPDRILPAFAWLDITGKAGVDDFGLQPNGRLVVSQPAFDVIKATQLEHCEVTDFE
jgi:hypothetical protein